MIDSGCQVNLARGSALPSFYWENTTDGGIAINGTPVPLQAKFELFPVNFNGIPDKLTVYRMEDLSEDCVLGVEFLHRVNPYLVDHTKMKFTCVLNGQPVSLPISFKSVPKCKITKVKPVHTPNRAQLMKMERSKTFSDVHGEKTLKNIAKKLKKD